MRFLLLIGLSAAAIAEANDGMGISSWASWNPKQVTRAQCPQLRSVPLILHWNKLEPEPGKYEFDKCLGDPLKAAVEDDLYATLMIWVGPACPMWIYEKGVPKVYSDREVNPLGHKMSKEQNRFPYYLAQVYKSRFFELIDAFGDYVNNLPPELRDHIIFVQSAEGSTGDGQPYKGKPIDHQYAISKEVWNDFRMKTWKAYQKAVPGIPILVNSDANTEGLSKWMLDNMDVIALKHGMFSHGYHVSDNRERLENFQWLEAEARKLGKRVMTRGEMDAELYVMGWSNRNVPQALYWSGLFATHCRLDIWNIPHMAVKDEANFPAFVFFNRYAGHTDPATAPAAFCALRDGLDASDFDRFPASEFGGKEGNKRDAERYVRIAEAYSKYGARMDDPQKAVGGGMVNRKRDGSNDVGWGILPGNYARFLTQLDPGSGDVGLWNIDDSIYGRFARAFEHKSGKTQMHFKLDETFKAKAVTVSVTYFDKGTGTWSLGIPGKTAAKRVQNTGSGLWKLETFSLPGSALDELLLKHEEGDDTVFHMVEIERVE